MKMEYEALRSGEKAVFFSRFAGDLEKGQGAQRHHLELSWSFLYPSRPVCVPQPLQHVVVPKSFSRASPVRREVSN
jgi:hypothetical protein